MALSLNTMIDRLGSGFKNTYAPRLSTSGPADVPKWNDDFGLDLDGLSDLFGAQANFNYVSNLEPRETGKPPTPTPTLDLKIGNPSVQDQAKSLVDWAIEKRYDSEYNAKLKAMQEEAAAAVTGAKNKWGGTGWAKSSYGYTGTTGTKGTRGPEPSGFQTPMWQALGKMNAAMSNAGLGTFTISGAWRSYDSQVTAKAKKGDLAAKPGNSIHGLGLAADLAMTDAQKRWLHDNAANFGLAFLGAYGKPEDWHVQLNPTVWNQWASTNNFSW